MCLALSEEGRVFSFDRVIFPNFIGIFAMLSPKEAKAERTKCRKSLISQLRADIKDSGVLLEEKEQKIVDSCASELEGVLLEHFYIVMKAGNSPSPKNLRRGRSVGGGGKEAVCSATRVSGVSECGVEEGNISGKAGVGGSESGEGGMAEGGGGTTEVGGLSSRIQAMLSDIGGGGKRVTGGGGRSVTGGGGRIVTGGGETNDMEGGGNGGMWKTSTSPSLKDDIQKMQAQLRNLEGEVEEVKQRGRKGTIIVASPSFKKGEKIASLFEDFRPTTSKSNDVENGPVDNDKDYHDLEKILDHIHTKYKVRVPVRDIVASHWLPNGDYILKFGDRSPRSAWRNLTAAMKSGGVKGVNLFCNFNLTRSRQALLKCARDLKAAKKIQQYKCDENGQICIRFNTSDGTFGPWMKVTQYTNKDGVIIHQRSVQDLTKLVHESQPKHN